MNNLTFRNSIRINMPETNSSSCHSITIFGKPDTNIDYLKDYIKTTKNPDDTLIIPGDNHFDRNNKDVSDVMGKIQYACTGVFDCWTSQVTDQKRKDMLEKVLKDYLAIDYIEYHWDNVEKIDEWADKNPDSLYSECPFVIYNMSPNELDHDSFDVHLEIYENEDTLRDFIFSSNSVAACGEIGVTAPSELYPALRDFGSSLVLRCKVNNRSIFFDKDSVEDSIDFFDLDLFPKFPFVCEGDIFSLENSYPLWYDFDLIHMGKDNYIKNDHNYNIIRNLNIKKSDPLYNILLGTYLTKDNKGRWNMCAGETKNPLDMSPILLRESIKYPFPIYFLEVGWLMDKDNISTLLKNGLSSSLFPNNPNIQVIKIIPEIIIKGKEIHEGI